MLTPEEAVHKMEQNPVETGAGFIAAGLLLKATFLVKLVSYALLTFGLIFLWKALKPKLEEHNTTPVG